MSTNYSSISIPYPQADPLQRYGSGHDLDVFGVAVSRASITKQMAFVRKTFLITTGQLIAISSLSAILVRVDPIFQWLQRSKYAWWVPLVPTFFIAVLIAWHLWMSYFQLSHVSRSSLLGLFSLFMTVIISDMISKLFYNEGILVIIMALFGLAGVLLYTLQTQFAFSGAKPLLVSAVTISMSSPWLRRVFLLDPISILWPMLLAYIVCCYFILELYYIMGTVTVDDYILANISFYIDLLYPMRCLHNICELTDNVDVFPDILHPGP